MHISWECQSATYIFALIVHDHWVCLGRQCDAGILSFVNYEMLHEAGENRQAVMR